MSGLGAYYFSFSPSDSMVYFDVVSSGILPGSMKLYLTNCISDPIESSNLFVDSNSVEHLSLNLYHLDPNETYILQLIQNGASTVTNLDVSYVSVPPNGPGSGPCCWPPPCTCESNCNRVVNGSFESFISLGNPNPWNPSNPFSLDGRIDYSFGWSRPLSNNSYPADYYHTNALNINSRVPINGLGTRTAKNGMSGTDAYGGLFAIWTSQNPNYPGQFREWMTGSLKNTLLNGHTYKVKYYVSITTKPGLNYDCVAPGLAFVTLDDQTLTSLDINNMNADIQNMSIQSAGGDWIEISGDYKANGNENFFIIANFLPDNQSVANASTFNRSYFYIDEVSVTDLDACCNNTLIIKDGWDVDDVLASADFAPFLIGSTLSTTSPVKIEGLFTINKNFTIDNTDFLIEKDGEIDILAGKKLTANNSLFEVCGQDMWNGFKINSNTAELVLTDSEIREAKKGINSLNGGKFTVTGSTFDANNYGIYVDNYPNMHQGTVKSSIFKASSNLLAPFSGRAEAGIYVNEVGYLVSGSSNFGINIGSSANSSDKNYFYGPGNGSTSGNLTPGLKIGVKAVYSSVLFYNNVFRDFIVKNTIDTQYKTGIYIEGVPDLYYFGAKFCPNVRIGFLGGNKPNYFYNSTSGIEGTGHLSTLVNANIFDMGSYSIASGSNAIKFIDDYINFESDYFIQNNSIKGVEKGIVVDNLYEIKTLYIRYNIIELLNIANNIGVYANSISPLYGTDINNNTISKCTRGIFIKDGNARIVNDNDITLNSTIYGTTSNIGIYYNNSGGAEVNNNMITSSNQTTNTKVYGFYFTSQSGLPQIQCNDISKTGTAMAFNNINYIVNGNSYIYANTMYLNHNCILLTNNTILGNIGFSNRASDNVWSNKPGYQNTGYHTYTYGADGNFSPLWTRGGGLPYEPTFNGSNIAIYKVDIKTNATGALLDCGGAQPCPGCFVAQNGNNGLPAFSSYYADDTAKWLAQYQYYVALANDSLIVNKAVQAFKDSMELSAVGKMLDFNENLNSSLKFKSSLLAVNPSNIQESKLKTVFNLKYDIVNNSWDTLPAHVFNTLNTIASECPFIEGPAVYEARALVNQFLNIGYNNPCEDYATVAPPLKRLKNPTEINADRAISVYPNPAKQIFNITIALDSKEKAQVILLDMNGRVMKKENLRNGTNELNIEYLSSGIYFYQIFIDDLIKQSDKLIIH